MCRALSGTLKGALCALIPIMSSNAAPFNCTPFCLQMQQYQVTVHIYCLGLSSCVLLPVLTDTFCHYYDGDVAFACEGHAVHTSSTGLTIQSLPLKVLTARAMLHISAPSQAALSEYPPQSTLPDPMLCLTSFRWRCSFHRRYR